MSQPQFVTVEGEIAGPSLLPLLGLPFGREWLIGRALPPSSLGYAATLRTRCVDVTAPHRACHWNTGHLKPAPRPAAMGSAPAASRQAPVDRSSPAHPTTAPGTTTARRIATSRVALVRSEARRPYRTITCSAAAGAAIAIACLMLASPQQPAPWFMAASTPGKPPGSTSLANSNQAGNPHAQTQAISLARADRPSEPHRALRPHRHTGAVPGTSRHPTAKAEVYRIAKSKTEASRAIRQHAKPVTTPHVVAIESAPPLADLLADIPPPPMPPARTRATAPLAQVDWMSQMTHRRLTEDSRFLQ